MINVWRNAKEVVCNFPKPEGRSKAEVRVNTKKEKIIEIAI
jgi:hypothetical protein